MPPVVLALHYEFEGWLGDDLLTTDPCFVVTERLKDALLAFGGTGYSFENVEISKSSSFYGGEYDPLLHSFFWLKVRGIAGIDDIGLSKNRLVVNDRVLELLGRFRITNCLIRKKPFNTK